MKAEPFENVKNQIGFCGIWCGSCVVGNGVLMDLTKRYEEIIKGYGVEKWGPKDFDVKEFMKGLKSIQAIPLCKGCLKGDGNPNCEIRICALKKNISDCSECDQSAACKNTEKLQKVRTGARQANLLIKIKNVNRQELVEKWTTELKSKWPCCILFIHDQ